MKYKNEYVEVMIDQLLSDGWCPDDIIREIQVPDCNGECDCKECWKERLRED